MPGRIVAADLQGPGHDIGRQQQLDLAGADHPLAGRGQADHEPAAVVLHRSRETLDRLGLAAGARDRAAEGAEGLVGCRRGQGREQQQKGEGETAQHDLFPVVRPHPTRCGASAPPRHRVAWRQPASRIR